MDDAKIHFIESGVKSASSWLKDAELKSLYSARGRHGTKARIVEIREGETSSDSIICKVRTPQGEIVEEPFGTVVESLFKDLHQQNQLDQKAIMWPGYDLPLDASTSCTSDTKCAEQIHEEPKRESIPNNPFAAVGECADDTDDKEFDYDTAQDCSQDILFDDDEDPSNEHGPVISDMQPSIANACWRNLNSTEPQNGFSTLSHTLSSWKYMPNENLKASFSDFLTSGPMNEQTKMHEPHRTELVFAYLEKVLGTISSDDCCNTRIVGPCNLEELLSLTVTEASEIYLLTATDADMHRLARALQFCSQSLGYAAKSITIELQRIVRGETEATRKILSNMPFSACFLQGNVRENLKITVRNAAQLLVRHGHWLKAFPGEETHKYNNRFVQNCAIEVQNCLRALGTLVSHATWLYCAREEVSIPDRDCCFLIKDVVETELAKIDYSKISSKKKIGMKMKSKYATDLKLCFLFALDTKFSKDLQLELSQLFGLSKEVKLVLE